MDFPDEIMVQAKLDDEKIESFNPGVQVDAEFDGALFIHWMAKTKGIFIAPTLKEMYMKYFSLYAVDFYEDLRNGEPMESEEVA